MQKKSENIYLDGHFGNGKQINQPINQVITTQTKLNKEKHMEEIPVDEQTDLYDRPSASQSMAHCWMNGLMDKCNHC